MTIRLNIIRDPGQAYAYAREGDAFDEVTRRMTRTFDVFTYYAIGVAVILAAFLAVTALAGRPTIADAPCGFVAEDGENVPAYCGNLQELDARLDAIHAERSGRDW